MPNPTVWAVTAPDGNLLDVGRSAFDAVRRAWQTGLNDAVLKRLGEMVADNHGASAIEHAGYRVAPMALVTPEALAVVEGVGRMVTHWDETQATAKLGTDQKWATRCTAAYREYEEARAQTFDAYRAATAAPGAGARDTTTTGDHA